MSTVLLNEREIWALREGVRRRGRGGLTQYHIAQPL
jgi:hypothetical protein